MGITRTMGGGREVRGLVKSWLRAESRLCPRSPGEWLGILSTPRHSQEGEADPGQARCRACKFATPAPTPATTACEQQEIQQCISNPSQSFPSNVPVNRPWGAGWAPAVELGKGRQPRWDELRPCRRPHCLLGKEGHCGLAKCSNP